MNMTILAIILAVLVFLKPIILILSIVPVACVHSVIAGRGCIRGRRFFCFADELLLYWIAQIPSHVVRMFYYRRVFKIRIGRNVVIYKGCEIRCPERLVIGDNSIIGDDAVLDAREGLTIGKNVNLSSGVSIWTCQHDYRDPYFACTPEHCGPVVVEDRVWLGPRTTVLHDVTLGTGSVVAAGAVVTKSVAAYEVVSGVPARRIADRPQDLKYEFDGSHRRFI